MASLNQDILQRIELRTISIEEQTRIVAMLQVLDDLVENNLRRIEILEEMARTIYREWFVNFRFPGYEQTKLTASRLALVPAGWDITRLADITSTQYGFTESTSEDPVGPKFLRGMDFNKRSYIDWSAVPYCRITPDDFEKFRLHREDVVVIRMADPGKAGIVEDDVDAVFASYLVRVTPDRDHLLPYFLFHYLQSREYQGYISGASTGTTRKSASAKVMTGSMLPLPPLALQSAFTDTVRPIRQLLNTLLRTNANLRSTRDLLLPRVIAGEIDVLDLDIDTSWLAA